MAIAKSMIFPPILELKSNHTFLGTDTEKEGVRSVLKREWYFLYIFNLHNIQLIKL